MHNLSLAIKLALESLIPMHIMDIGNLSSLNTIATPSDVVYMMIEQVRLVEASTARITPTGQPYGTSYEVLYRLAMRHENALSSNLMTDLLNLRLAGMESTITREAYYIGRNVYYIMSIPAIAIIAYPQDAKSSQKINRVYISINGRDAHAIDFDAGEKNEHNRE